MSPTKPAGTVSKTRAAARPTQKSAAASAHAEVNPAQAENGPAVRVVETQGLTLDLPATFPPELFMDMIEAEATSGTGQGYLTDLRMLRSLVGPDQFIDIRHAVGSDPDKVLLVLNDVLNVFGMSMGESEASPGS